MNEWLNRGRVAVFPRGEWNPALEYRRLDMVSAADQIKCYVAVKDVPAGTPLNDETYWRVSMDGSNLQRQIDVERGRIDTFVALPEGATTSDSEVADVRVGWDGTVYNNAGEAVREQHGKLMGMMIESKLNEPSVVIGAGGHNRLHKGLFVNGGIGDDGNIAPGDTHAVVTERIISLPFGISLSSAYYPFAYRVAKYDESDNLIDAGAFGRLDQTIEANERFRVAIMNTEVMSGVADIAEYVEQLQVYSAQNAPDTIVSDGAVNAMVMLAEEYFKWAYNPGGSSPLIYAGSEADNSHWYTGMKANVTEDGVNQYSINCSGFLNTLLQAVPLYGSRYTLGAGAGNQKQNWGYRFDETARLGDFIEVKNSGEPTLHNNLGSVATYDMFRYAEQHGFAYRINDDFSNVRPGDAIFVSDFAKYPDRYKSIHHCALCLGVAKDSTVGDDGIKRRRMILLHSTTAQRTDPDTGNTYPVGVAIANLDYAESELRYAARFPIGHVSSAPEIAARGYWDASANRMRFNQIDRGIYTIVIKGEFSSNPRWYFSYEGSGTADYMTTIKVDERTYVMTRYWPKGISMYVRAGNDSEIFRIDSAVVYHGYASPFASADQSPDALEYINLDDETGLDALNNLHANATNLSAYRALVRGIDLSEGSAILPERAVYFLEGNKYNADNGIQRITSYRNPGQVYQRGCNLTNWSEWALI